MCCGPLGWGEGAEGGDEVPTITEAGGRGWGSRGGGGGGAAWSREHVTDASGEVRHRVEERKKHPPADRVSGGGQVLSSPSPQPAMIWFPVTLMPALECDPFIKSQLASRN